MMRNSITFHTESGQTMAEYALVLGVITFVIVTTFSLLSDTIVAAYTRTFDILASVV
jgi:Flp pilus assembly pilin Flp